MSRIAIIPARGGSKRIPRKNIRLFLGKPIIAYSIETALGCGLFDEVMVSTDDTEIAEVAKRYGAKVPFLRSNGSADDHATTTEVLIEVLNEYKHLNSNFEIGCCIYPTAPFVKMEDLSSGLKKLVDNNFDSVFPIVAFDYPIWRALKIVDNRVEMIWEEHSKARSQDLEEVYHDAGQWYWFNVNSLMKNSAVISGNSGGIELPSTRVQDIDTDRDWVLAELKMKYYKE
ncbi:MAG: pseudaminic acid cytidylyltransferase [Cyclobacteriaceae bacterium]